VLIILEIFGRRRYKHQLLLEDESVKDQETKKTDSDKEHAKTTP